ncbi:MAG: NAD(P)/FAD-dependent oxidoreductase, partial [[Clostridium] symbiosum]
MTNTAEKNETGVGLSMKKQVTIIGAGASGMTAAIFAARQGAQVTLLEHMDRVGKKILSTGNGKCNLSNRFMEETCYRSGVADFPMEVISRFTVEETLSFFEDLGIVVKDRNGYLYPHSGQASSVLDVLRAELDHRRIRTVTECRIDAVRYRETGDKRFKVSTSQGSFLSDCLSLATGSIAAPAT